MKAIVVSICVLFMAYVCPSAVNAPHAVDETSGMMSDASELALLMREMHSRAKDWRHEIERGKLPLVTESYYHQILSSKATKADVTSEALRSMAFQFQNALDSLMAVQDVSLALHAYNNVVTTCLNCHQAHCPGPITTIKKLYLKE